ncbi:MAG: DNA internalization-related competence protein ComEC/Rec2 [Bacillota bacterium]
MENKNGPVNRSNSLIAAISNRFLLTLTLYYCTGILIAYLWVVRYTGLFWPVVIILALTLLIFYYRVFVLYKAVLFLLAAAAGGAAFYYAYLPSNHNITSFAGSSLYFEGTIIEEPVHYDEHSVYNLEIEMAETGKQSHRLNGVIQLRIYEDQGKRYWYGERLGIKGKIVEPRGMRNPGGFDYRLYLRSQGVDALIYANSSQVSFLGTGHTNFLAASAIRLRSNMTEQIKAALPSPSAELLIAILFGQRHHLPPEVEDNFRRAGAGHLMAVSGLHVGMVAALVLGLWSRMNLRGRIPLVLAIVMVFAYAYLTGMRPSALRAAIMVSLALGAMLLDRENDLPTAVSFAALATLFINPLLLFSVGFQLSYAAALTIIYAYRPLEHIISRLNLPGILTGPLAITIAAQLGVMPLCLYYFHHFPAGALLFNILLLPLIAFIVGIGLTGAVTGLIVAAGGEILLWAVYPLLELMMAITALAKADIFYHAVIPPGILFLVIYYSLMCLALRFYYLDYYKPEVFNQTVAGRYSAWGLNIISRLYRYKPAALAIIGLALFVIMIWFPILFPGQHRLKVTFIDVGQGAAALIEAPCGMTVMVDGGGRPAYQGSPGVVGERVVLPFLRERGIKRLDLAVITHPHEDHYGGFIPLLESMPVDTIFVSQLKEGAGYYEALLEDANAAGSQIYEIRAGQTWLCCDELSLEVINPPDKLLSGTGNDSNNNSIVFKMHYKEMAMLFTGDIEDEAVNQLFRNGECLQADLLLIPHHGGFMESIPRFLEAVDPVISIIQVGVNSFGHPHPFVIKTLDDKGIPVYRNDYHGAVIVETDGSKLQITTMEKPEITVNQ